MTPIESNQLLVQFAAPISPWWLLLVAPAAGLVGWRLYRRDHAALAPIARRALTTFRCVLLVALAVLAFRPNLVQRATLTYPGRVIFAIDDSRSMLARDDRMSDSLALQLHRSQNPSDTQDAPFKSAADQAAAALGRMQEFERFSRNAERSSDAFWDRAGKIQQEIEQHWIQAGESATASKVMPEKNLPDAVSKLDSANTQLAELRAATANFFVGDRWPGHRVFVDYYTRGDALILTLLDLQSILDRQQLASGNAELQRKADAVRARSRLELAGAQLTAALPAISRSLSGQGLEVVHLSSGARHTLDRATLQALTSSAVPTRIADRLQAIADEPSDFPVSGIVLVSDGRDLSRSPIAPVEAALSRQQIPVLAVGAGEPTEPTDIAIADIVAPPIAIANRPAVLHVMLKAAIDRPAQTQLDLTRDGKSVQSVRVELTPGDRVSVPITFTPDHVGVFRYAVKIASPEKVSEIFPNENNSAQFILNVRKEPVRVLLFDWKPRWETRFALNVLQRMPYVDLNTIITATQKDELVARAAQRGAWPESDATLNLYDLVVLGDLPDGQLTDAEWKSLATWSQRGKTIVFLGSRNSQGRLRIPESAQALLPIDPAIAPTTQPKSLLKIDDFRLTHSGSLHPLTLQLSNQIAAGELKSTTAGTALRSAAQPLMLGPGDLPIMAWQPVGQGKCLFIDSDRFWQALNPTAHRAHQQMFVELVTWAVESQSDADAKSQSPRLLLHQQRGLVGQPVQVLAQNVRSSAMVDAVDDGKIVASRPLGLPREGSSLFTAEFLQPSAGNLIFRLKDDPAIATAPVLLTSRDDELTYLARNDAWLEHLAGATGGEFRPLFQLERLLQSIDPKQRVERREHVWRLWDSPAVMSLLVLILTVEWVWRKFVGLV